MAHAIPQYIVDMLADRVWRMEHYIWHEVRNGWLFFDKPTRDALTKMGWAPPRPAQQPGANGPVAIIDNDSGEDFLYMHHEMIKMVNARLNDDPTYPNVDAWQQLPRPGDPDYPVPPVWDAADTRLKKYLDEVKSDNAFATRFRPWEAQFTDPRYLKTVTLGELGARIEFSIHNQMHMRWCAKPTPGIRPDADDTNPEGIDRKWDSPAYDWLGDTYSSHVNSVFWNLHGWVDTRIGDWAHAHDTQGPIPWRGTWLGKMPGHSMPRPMQTNTIAVDRRSADHLEELTRAVVLIAKQGHSCHFYDNVEIPTATK